MSFKHLDRIMKSGKQEGNLGLPTRKALELAENIDKESFLTELADQWYDHIQKHSNIEEEVVKARVRIKKSGFETVFNKVGITDDDLKDVIRDIQDVKPEQVIVEKKVDRNSPCTCGSGKKYKKCCGKLKEV